MSRKTNKHTIHSSPKQPHHSDQTAQQLMTTSVPVVRESATISDIEQLLLDKTVEFETINYIYVVDQANRLKGELSIKEIFRSPKNQAISKLPLPKIISVRAHTDQKRIAFLAVKHGLKSIPVVDKDDQFLGVVPSDKIIRIIDSKAVENILRFGGILRPGSYDDVLHLSLTKSLKHRLPWLILGLAGGILTSGIIKGFEDVLAKNLILAAFIPLIVYMADAVGTQMEAFIIRDLAVNPTLVFFKYFYRQLRVVTVIGIISSALLYFSSLAIYHSSQTSLVLSAALFFAIASSVLSGLAIPFLFSKLKLDPANASGLVATIIQDILSIFVYFGIASIFL